MTELIIYLRKRRKVQLSIVSLCMFLLCTTNLYAQSPVRGVVTDDSGHPLPGVTVMVKSARSGVVTDMDGAWIIQADPRSTLTFSYIGMITQEVKVGGRTHIDVVMREDIASLEEVIVVGYGIQKKSSLTGAVSAIKGDELLKAPATNISSVLGGRLPGIASVQESGEPGLDQATLTIRGSRYSAVYIVDGIPRSIDEVDPNDIESISVLKDGAAVAVYGLQAAGG